MKKQLAEDVDLSQEILDDPEGMERLLAATRWEAMMEMVNRREAAAKQVTPCPKCDSIQVQLVNWQTPQLQMKCRICFHKFVKELK